MVYDHFAKVYDELMENVPYDQWLNWFEEGLQKYHSTTPRILEVGCGTGTLLKMLLKHGYDVDGVDISNEMLAIATTKIRPLSSETLLMQQDMRSLNIGKTYDVVIVFCDSLNYLTEKEDIRRAFRSFWRHLNNGGLLFFDVHSVHYVEEILHGFSFAEDREHVAYIWNIFPTTRKGEVLQELTLFFEREPSFYERFVEVHQQRTFSIDTYQELLHLEHFDTLGTYADFTWLPPKPHSERLFFVAKKL